MLSVAHGGLLRRMGWLSSRALPPEDTIPPGIVCPADEEATVTTQPRPQPPPIEADHDWLRQEFKRLPGLGHPIFSVVWRRLREEGADSGGAGGRHDRDAGDESSSQAHRPTGRAGSSNRPKPKPRPLLRYFMAGTRFLCARCAGKEPLALPGERPAEGGVAIRCDECGRLIEPEDPHVPETRPGDGVLRLVPVR